MELRIFSDEDVIVSSERIEPESGEKQSFMLVIHGNGNVYVTLDNSDETRATTIGEMFQNGTVVGPPFGDE